MIVYGDAPRRIAPREALDGLEAALRGAGVMAPGVERHAALVGALIEAGALAQGIIDAETAIRGHDAASPATEALSALLDALSRSVLLSWNSGFARFGAVPPAVLAAPRGLSLPEAVEAKRAEGFAYYALYPEAYAAAAAALPDGVRVIGLRSIGTVLGAVVGAARGAAVLSVRPVGHPFRRALAVEEATARAVVAGPDTPFAVVDEGPGLSGSSFGAAIDFLQARGVDLGRIHLLPGHAGAPGPEAGEAARARWDRVARHPASFEALLLDSGRLAAWATGLLGPATAPMEEISGGGWRGRRFARAADWPPVHPFMERRKFLHRTADGTWLLKFVGLGAHGEAAAARARALHAAGFGPPVAGLLHGFLAERWVEEARPLDPAGTDRAALVARLGAYLGFRARALAGEGGASAQALWEMARQNAREALGPDLSARLARWEPHLARLEAGMHRVWTDNRLHAWEWLALPDGRLLKADAVDHAAAHDLIGCQDIAWDVAGAAVEMDLSAAETDTLRDAVARETGRPVAPGLLAFLTPCYLAFQAGYHTMAADAFGWNPPEAARARAAAGRYAERLSRTLRG